MTLWSYQRRRSCAVHLLAAFLLLTRSLCGAETNGPADVDPSSLANVQNRLRELEQSQQSLIEQNRQLSSRIKSLSGQNSQYTNGHRQETALVPPAPSSDPHTDEMRNLSSPAPETQVPANIFAPSFDTSDEFPLERQPSWTNSGTSSTAFVTSFDRGFVIRPTNSEETPFELKINGQNQIRYTGFEREDPTWTDSAGVTSPVNNMSNFQIPRGRLIFSGYTFRKELLYNLNIDYNTVGNSQINFRAYWLAWRFNRAMTLYAGQSKVPGGREWLLSFVDTQGADRSMATTFFRPSLSQGIWATGEPIEGVFYHVMMSNGFNTLGSTPQQLSSLMAFSGSMWWEPLGEFGRGYSDFECHSELAMRLGTSLTYAPERGPQGGSSVPENADIRLSDGTLITQSGALAPGVTLNAFKIGLTSVDLAFKYRGLSLSGEFYSQDLFELSGSGPLPRSSIHQYGGFAQAGLFVIPQKLEPYVRTSYVTGPNGTGSEYAGGFNWFFLPGKQNLRFTLDAAWLNQCPADQNRTNLQAGQTGILVRSQLQIFF
ncbi:MAG: porin [Planctomycetes bacterium]|nr:porin [Planctomycetota bacterium]